jgi:hypothetical protein
MKVSKWLAKKILGTTMLLITLRSANAEPFPELNIVFPTDTLVGYSGESLCSLSNLVCENLVTGLGLGPGSQLCGSPVTDCAQNASFSPVLPAGTFELSGTLQDGAVLGGAMTLNEITGAVTAASFSIGRPYSFTLSVITYDGTDTSPSGRSFWLLEVEEATTAVPEPGIGRGLPVLLVGMALYSLALRRQAQR